MMTSTAPATPTALERGIAAEEAAVRVLEALLADVQAWRDLATAELDAVLQADRETNERAVRTWRLAVDAQIAYLRAVFGAGQRLAQLRSALTTTPPASAGTHQTSRRPL